MKLVKNNITLIVWFAFLFTLLVMVSCKPTKPISEFKEEVKKDSLNELISINKNIEKSLPIKDTTAYNVPKVKTGVSKNCDSVCDAKIVEIMKQFNRSISSGKNKYKLLFDENQRQLLSITEMGETINQFQDSIHKMATVKQETKIVKEVVERKVYPKWLVYLAIIGAFSILFWIYRFTLIFKP